MLSEAKLVKSVDEEGFQTELRELHAWPVPKERPLCLACTVACALPGRMIALNLDVKIVQSLNSALRIISVCMVMVAEAVFIARPTFTRQEA